MSSGRGIFFACLLSFALLGCASSGLVLKPKESDVYRGARNYHFANNIIGFDFYFIKTDEELMAVDKTAIFIENRTGFQMTVIFSLENKKIVAREVVPPWGQGVVSVVWPYGEWLNLSILTDKNYATRIKLEQ